MKPTTLRAVLKTLEKAQRSLDQIVISALPSTPIHGKDWNDDLRSIAAVYFIVSESKGLLYIGKAGSLRARWYKDEWVQPSGGHQWTVRHHREYASRKLGDCRLYWLEVPTEYLGLLESLLICKHDPPWNGSRTDAKDAIAGDPTDLSHEPENYTEEFKAIRKEQFREMWKD